MAWFAAALATRLRVSRTVRLGFLAFLVIALERHLVISGVYDDLACAATLLRRQRDKAILETCYEIIELALVGDLIIVLLCYELLVVEEVTINVNLIAGLAEGEEDFLVRRPSEPNGAFENVKLVILMLYFSDPGEEVCLATSLGRDESLPLELLVLDEID